AGEPDGRGGGPSAARRERAWGALPARLRVPARGGSPGYDEHRSRASRTVPAHQLSDRGDSRQEPGVLGDRDPAARRAGERTALDSLTALLGSESGFHWSSGR